MRIGISSRCILIALLGVCLFQVAAMASTNFIIGNSFGYFTGHYGRTYSTNIYYDSIFGAYKIDRWDFRLTIPYESITGLPADAILSGNSLAAGGHSAVSHGAAGLGDISLSASYRLLPAIGLRPGLAPYLTITFGSASVKNGLGTGRTNYEVGSVAYENLGWVYPYVTLGYRFVGAGSRYNLRNIWVYGAGATISIFRSGRALSRNFVTIGYSGAESEEPGVAASGAVLLAGTHVFSHGSTKLQIYMDKGLTDSSPGIGVGIAIQRGF